VELIRLQVEENSEREKNKDVEIELYKKELESEKMMYEHLLKENTDSLDHFKGIQADLNEKLSEFISRNTELEIENTQLKGDVRELTLRSNEDVERIRDEYERMMESNRKLYDDEMELMRVQR
jgi:predicted nuclease with TOPRIM domain